MDNVTLLQNFVVGIASGLVVAVILGIFSAVRNGLKIQVSASAVLKALSTAISVVAAIATIVAGVITVFQFFSGH
jgi:hypothetical protein